MYKLGTFCGRVGIIAIAVGGMQFNSRAQGAEAAKNFAEVGSVIAQVKLELQAMQEVPIGEPRLELSEVILNLKGVVSRDAQGSLKIQVPVVGASVEGKGSISSSRTQTLTLVLAPPKPIIVQNSRLSGDMEIANAIIAIRRQLAAGLKQEPLLLPRKLEFELSFTVKIDAAAKGGVKLVFVEFGAAPGYNNENSQKLVLSFVSPKGPRT